MRAKGSSISDAAEGFYPRGSPPRGAQVTAIDLSAKAIEVAIAHAEETGGEATGIDYRKISIGELLKEGPKPFDVVVCSEVLEHVDDLSSFMKEAC